MSIRARLYEAIAKLPDRDPVVRIAATGEFLDSLPEGEAEVAARRLLALTLAYEANLQGGMKGTLDEFFQQVDEIERSLVN